MSLIISTDTKASSKRYKKLKRELKNTIESLGMILLEIRDKKLYLEEYPSFEAFLNEEVKISRRHGYRLISAAKVVKNVTFGTHVEPPRSERTARELGRLPAEEQPVAWEYLVNDGGQSKPITFKDVREYIEEKQRTGPDEHLTDPDIFAFIYLVLHGISLDPCAPVNLSDRLTAQEYYSIDDDGLSKDWFGRVFVHPPISKTTEFVEKAILEFNAGKIDACALYLPANHCAEWEELVRKWPRLYFSEFDPNYKASMMLVLIFRENKYFLNFESESDGFGQVYIYNG